METQLKYRISCGDVDKSLNLKISSILRLFQDLCVFSMEDIGFGKDKVFDKGYLWVILKTYIEIYKLPKYEDTIIIKTHPGDLKIFLYERYFSIEDLSGNVLVRLSSIWALIEKTKRLIASPKETGVIANSDKTNDDLPMPKIKVPTELKKSHSHVVTYSDLDFNSHLNNIKYLDMAFDSHNLDFYMNHETQSIFLEYDKEVKENEVLDIFNSFEDNIDSFIIKKSDGIVAFKGQIKYK